MAGPEVTHDRTLLPRKRIPVREVIVHEDYRTDGQTDDIALLKLSEYLSLYIQHTGRRSGILFIPILPPGERVDLFTYPPACLPGQEQGFVGKDASVYGE